MHYTNAFIRGKKAPFRGVFKYKDSEGNWHQTVRTLKAQGITDARRELTEVRAQLEEEHEQAQFVARTTMTVGEYVENYINRLDETKVLERSTVNGYLCMLGYIRDGLDKVRLTQLSAAQVQAWEAKLLTDGLSATTVRKAHMLLKSALKYSVETEVLPKNPMAPVKAPKIDTPLPNALDDGARRLLVTFLDNAPRTPFNLGVLLALSTGMREGEICGLRWSDVSFRTNTLWVRRSIARDNGSYYVKQPKTRGSIRDIPLTSKAVEWLKDRKGAQEAELVVAGLSPTVERMGALYVLGGVDGSHMAPHTLSKGWKSIADSMGLVGTQGRRPTFHDLRHTFATYAISEGIDVKTVRSILGHSSAAMTLNIYASADPSSKRAAVETIDSVMGRRLTKKELERYA